MLRGRLAILLLSGAALAPAVTITRGPYLQMAGPDRMTFRWRTDEPTESVVLHGPGVNNVHFITGDLTETTEHEVTLLGLEPETQYFYAVGEFFNHLAEGPEYQFITPPLQGRVRPTRVWAIGDCGTAIYGDGNQAAVRDAYYNFTGSRRTDVWLALGDNAYNYGSDEEYQISFFDVYPALLRQSALWSTIGNHETYSVPPGERIPYLDIFNFPTQGEAGGVASGTEKYYSFTHANIHFVCLDSELSDRTPAGPMLTWLQADLAANTNDWLIAFWHSPPYTKGSHNSDNPLDGYGNLIEMRAHAAQMLEYYGADLVLGGHSHNYERSFLINGHYGYSTSLTPSMIKDAGSGRPEDTGAYFKPETGPEANQGTVYIVAGSSGKISGRYGHHPVMFFEESALGSLVLDIDGPRLDAQFLRENGTVDDTFSIIKGAAPGPLRFCTFEIRNGQTIARWKSAADQTYQVEHTANLEAPQWLPISPSITASGATTSWTNAVPAGESRGFYRVVEME